MLNLFGVTVILLWIKLFSGKSEPLLIAECDNFQEMVGRWHYSLMPSSPSTSINTYPTTGLEGSESSFRQAPAHSPMADS